MPTTKRPSLLLKPASLIAIAALLAIAVAAAFWAHRHTTPKVSPAPTPTIHQLPSQKSTPGAAGQMAAPSGKDEGTSVDKQGAPTSISTPSSQWTQSQSGVITVKTPVANATLQNGDTVAGSATIDKVQYRLIDADAGVISQGFINVVNGNFTASISFKHYASSGRLDVFSTDGSGKEINEVQIPVKF